MNNGEAGLWRLFKLKIRNGGRQKLEISLRKGKTFQERKKKSSLMALRLRTGLCAGHELGFYTFTFFCCSSPLLNYPEWRPGRYESRTTIDSNKGKYKKPKNEKEIG